MDWTRHWDTPYLVGTGDFPLGVNKLERGPDHSFQSNAEVYNLCTFTSTPTACVRSIVIGTEKNLRFRYFGKKLKLCCILSLLTFVTIVDPIYSHYIVHCADYVWYTERVACWKLDQFRSGAVAVGDSVFISSGSLDQLANEIGSRH